MPGIENAKVVFNRYLVMSLKGLTLKDGSNSGCGANAKGGHGFQPGNKCGAKKGGSGDSASGKDAPDTDSAEKKKAKVANPIDIPEVSVPEEFIAEAMKIKEPGPDQDVDSFIGEIAKTKVYAKVNELLKVAEDQTITKNVTFASIEMNIECCPDAKEILAGDFEYTQERQELHQEIVKDMLPEDTRAKPGQKPAAVLLIGPPGAGKSSAGSPIIKGLGVNFATINNDDVKTALPEYKGWNAAMVQEESSLVVENEVMPKAMKNKHNMILDGVGKSPDKLLEQAKKLKQYGYTVHLVHVTIPTEKTVARAWGRFAKTAFKSDHPEGPGRYVPIDYVAKQVGQKPTNTYKVLRDSGLMDSWASYSNDVPRGEKPQLMDKGDKDAG